jgi:hypothetical protein
LAAVCRGCKPSVARRFLRCCIGEP